MRSRRNWCTIEGEVQALERLSQVMKALTPRHVDVVVCVAEMLKENPSLQGGDFWFELSCVVLS